MPLTIHDERLTRRVGAAVLVAAVLTVFFVVRVLGELGHEGTTVRIRFGEVLGLPQGAPVRLAGHDIGEVRSVSIAPGGGVFTVISIDDDWAGRIPVNSDFFVDARSPLAPRFIAIGPPAGGAMPGRPLRDGDQVIGIDPPNLDRVLQRTWDNLNEVSDFLDAIRPAARKISASSDRLAATVASLEPRPGASEALNVAVGDAASAAIALVDQVRAGQLDPDTFRRLGDRVDALATRIERTADELRGDVANIRRAIAGPGTRLAPGVLQRLDGLLVTADATLAEAQQLAGQVREAVALATAGRGAVAAFGRDLELVDDVRELTKQLKRRPWGLAAPPPSGQ